jgi:hypothetical protein
VQLDLGHGGTIDEDLGRRLKKTLVTVSLSVVMGRSSSLALTIVALVLAVAPPASTQTDAGATARSEDELRRLYTGAWMLTVSHATGQAAIDRGIERAVTEMNYFVQSLARSQMRDQTPVNDRIDIAFPDGQITIGFDQRFTYTTQPGIAQDFDLPDGTHVNVRQYFRDGHLEQYFEHSLGRRWNVYTLSADGHTMTVRATQQGPMMPAPMSFALEYRQ